MRAAYMSDEKNVSTYSKEMTLAAQNTEPGDTGALTHGEGAPEFAFGGYRPVEGPIPTRLRTDNNPLNRKEYLLRVVRRFTTR